MNGHVSELSIVIIFTTLLISYYVVPASGVTNALSQPKVTQKSASEMMTYVKSLGPMMNITRLAEGVGNTTDVEAALYGNNTYVASISSNSSARNHVYIQVNHSHPPQFSHPVELTNSSRIVNASHLGIAAFNKTDILVIWQDTKQGKGTIWISESDDSGHNFTTYQQSNGTNAKDPKIVTDGKNVFYSWLQLTTKNCNSPSATAKTPPLCWGIFAHGHHW